MVSKICIRIFLFVHDILPNEALPKPAFDIFFITNRSKTIQAMQLSSKTPLLSTRYWQMFNWDYKQKILYWNEISQSKRRLFNCWWIMHPKTFMSTIFRKTMIVTKLLKQFVAKNCWPLSTYTSNNDRFWRVCCRPAVISNNFWKPFLKRLFDVSKLSSSQLKMDHRSPHKLSSEKITQTCQIFSYTFLESLCPAYSAL